MPDLKKSWVALLCGLFIFSCADKKNEMIEVDGTAWTLVQMPGDLPASETISLQFQEGKINGKAICNSYFSDYKIEGKSISFGPIGATKMMCPKHADVEVKYFDALRQAQEVQTSNKQLVIKTGGGDLIFEATNPTNS